ncbi:dynein axonemal assembly factor 11 [Aplochiton taeniatus]
MVHITEEMVRRRAEHNNCEIFTLEELSLHQQDIERLEYVDKWCKDLKILYLQNNLIPRIENVGRLKKVEYLNLALNNIEVIENLEGCESLQKLDLTVNFVGQLCSVELLRNNLHLRELFLVGNPCSEFEGYRQYVVVSLPQLKYLDGKEISRSERIQASQGFEKIAQSIKRQERDYLKRRAREKEEALEEERSEKKPGFDGRWYTDINNTVRGSEVNKEDSGSEMVSVSSEDQEREFWEKPCSFTPESRVQAHRHLENKKKEKETKKETKAPRTLITPEGRVMNVNEARLDFTLTEDEENNGLVLGLEVYRHMDSSLLDVDIQPTYVRVHVKGKIFQLVLPAEVKPDSSSAQRSQTTGHLVLRMPKAQGEICPKKPLLRPPKVVQSNNTPDNITRKDTYLEIPDGKPSGLNMITVIQKEQQAATSRQHPSFSAGFVDDPDVPPLM